MSWIAIILGSCVMGLISSIVMEVVFRKHHARLARQFNQELLDDLDCGAKKVNELKDQLDWAQRKGFQMEREIIQLRKEKSQ